VLSIDERNRRWLQQAKRSILENSFQHLLHATPFNKAILSMDYTPHSDAPNAVLQPPASEKTWGYLVASLDWLQGFSLEEPVVSEQFRAALGDEGIRIYLSH
jgi:hypothetical protein